MAARLPWILVGMSAVAALFGAWRITGTKAAVGFLAAQWPWLLIGAAAAVVLSVFVWWLWWRFPKWQVDRFPIDEPKGRADVEDNFRKTAGQLLGGAAVLIGAAFAYLQFTQQQQAGHDLLISNQVSKGFELLGNKDGQIEQRLGGIYALEGVMNDSERYHQPVLEALCAFVRVSTEGKKDDTQPRADVQGALTVIGRRRAGTGIVYLRGVHIPKAALGHADLTRADLSDTDLSDAELSGADLSGANLNGANLSDVDLSGANLTGAFLTSAKLSGAFSGAYVGGANLSDAKGLTQEQLNEACGDDKTKLDPPLTIQPCTKQ